MQWLAESVKRERLNMILQIRRLKLRLRVSGRMMRSTPLRVLRKTQRFLVVPRVSVAMSFPTLIFASTVRVTVKLVLSGGANRALHA